MASDYKVETIADYEKRFAYLGKPDLWIGVDLDNDTDPVVELTYSGNTTLNKTLTTYKPRPAIGHYVATSRIQEGKDSKIEPELNACGNGLPKSWRLTEDKLTIETEVAYSNNPIIDLLFSFATTATKDSPAQGFGGRQDKTPIHILEIVPNVVSYRADIFKCILAKGVIAPASKTYSNKNYTTCPLRFLAQELKKKTAGSYGYGEKLYRQWYVEVTPSANNLLTPQQVFDLIHAG